MTTACDEISKRSAIAEGLKTALEANARFPEVVSADAQKQLITAVGAQLAEVAMLAHAHHAHTSTKFESRSLTSMSSPQLVDARTKTVNCLQTSPVWNRGQ